MCVNLQCWRDGWCCTCWETLRVQRLSWQASWQASTETPCQAPKVLFLSLEGIAAAGAPKLLEISPHSYNERHSVQN